MRRLARLAAKIAVGAVVLVLLLALVGVILLRTAPGRRALVRIALPMLNARLAGHLSIGGVDGDVPSHFVIREVRLDDAEGFEAIYARRVEARLDWRALLHRHIRVEELRVEGARLTMRHLVDNRFNLAALTKPKTEAQKQKEAQKKQEKQKPPPLVTIEHFHLQLEGGYFPPRGHETHRIEWPRGTFDIDGDAWFRGADMHFTVAHFQSDARDPLQAHVELRGGLRVEPGKAHGHAEMTFEDVSVTVETDGAQLQRLSPLIRAQGRWSLHADGGGPLANLHARALLSAPAGHVAVAGEMSRLFPGVRWRALVDAAGLDPGADWRGLPSGDLELALRGSGVRNTGELIVDKLRGTMAGVLVEGAGRSDFQGRGEGVLRAHVDDLGRVWRPAAGKRREPGALEKLAGAVDVVARLSRDAHGPRLSATLDGRGLAMRQARLDARVGQVTAALQIVPRRAPVVTLSARDLAVAPASVERAREKRHGAADTLPPTPTTSEAPGASSAASKAPPYVRLATLGLTARGLPSSLALVVTATTESGMRATTTMHAALGSGTARAHIATLDLAMARHHYTLPSPADVQVAVSGAQAHARLELAGAHAEAKASLQRDRVTAELHAVAPELARLVSLDAGAQPPLSGWLRLDGRVALGESLRVVATAETRHLHAGPLTLARATLAADTRDLAGNITVHGESLAAGKLALARLDVHAHADGQQLRLTVDGERPSRDGATRVALDVAGRWQSRRLSLAAADLLVRKLSVELPRQSWALVRPARLVVDGHGLTLTALSVRSGLGQLDLDARVFPSHALDVRLALRDGELQELGRLVSGRADLLPPARWSGQVRARGTLAAPLVEAALTAKAERTVAWYGLAFNSLGVNAWADSRHAILHLEARGKDTNRLVIDAHATPLTNGDGTRALEATLDRLQLTVNQHGWELREPCRLHVASRVEILQCTLGSGRAEIALGGVVPLAAAAPVELMLSTRRLDLRDLGALAAPGHKEPPKTSFDARVHVAGTRAQPTVDLELAGTGSQVDEGLPENVRYQIRAHYADGRVKGQASMRQVGVRLGIGAQFDLPVLRHGLDGPEEPLSLELEARPVPFFKIRNLLPPSLANLQGFFTLRLRAGGTTRHPTLSGELHAPSWGLDDLRDNDTIVDVDYDGKLLRVNSVTSFQATTFLASVLRIKPKRNSGTIKMALKAPLDLVALVEDPRHALAAFGQDAPVEASAEVRAVDLAKVPLQIVGLTPPVTTGQVDGSARLSGTLRHPSLHAELRGRELGKAGRLAHADVDAELAWERGRADLTGRLRLGGAALLDWRGHVAVDGGQLFCGGDWRAAALSLDVDAPELDLSRVASLQPRLHGLDGKLAAHATLRGTLGAPSLRVHAEGHGLHVGEARFAGLRLDGEYAARAWTIAAAAEEEAGGTLRLAGTVPRDREHAPLSLDVTARGLDIGFLSATWEEIGELHGTLDARLAVGGTRAEPRLDGNVHLSRGRFGWRWDSRRYTDGELDLAFSGRDVTLARLRLRGGDGALAATGRATLDGGVPMRIDLDAHADKLLLAYGSASAWLDADFTVAGDRKNRRWDGSFTLRRGTIKLPDLDGGEPIFRALPDVELVDKRPPRDAKLPAMTMLVRVDHPLELRSKEVAMTLAGEVVASLGDGQRRLEGVVEGVDGTMELLGRRYRVERAQLAFTGPPDDPELHLRVTRKLGAATLALVIEGTAQHPSVRLACDPPIYDESQLTSMVLAGRPNEDRIAIHDLKSKVAGLLSAMVVRKIEEQLAPSLPIDVVKPLDQQSYAEFSQAPLEVGRFVTDRIYVSYAQRAGSRMGRSAANVEEARAEYRLGRGWELDTTFGDQGVGGVYIMWTARH